MEPERTGGQSMRKSLARSDTRNYKNLFGFIG